MNNIQIESLVVLECQRGDTAPLAKLLEPLKSPLFELLICLSIKRSKPAKITRRDLIGYQVDAMLRKRPGEKKQICYELASPHRAALP